jgi:hypothetical protein
MWRGRDPARNLELVATHDELTIPGLQMPGYMAFDSHGHFDVVNRGNPRSWCRTGTGASYGGGASGARSLGIFDFLGGPADPRSALGGTDLAADGSVYVVESAGKRVQRFTTGDLPQSFGGGR